jgi:opacity protein-like surface antigen
MMLRSAIRRIPLLLLLLAATSVHAASAVDELLQRYAAQGARTFDAAAAEAQWNKSFVDAASGENRRCSTCHTMDLKAGGKHATTGKAIEPLAPSVNPKRLTDIEKIEKWFLRNCKWTMGRECTPQEKGNYLVMIRSK